MRSSAFCGLLLGLLTVCALNPAPALAHDPVGGHLELRARGERIEGRLDVALHDLEHALGLDTDLDGAITWGELRARRQEIAAYVLARLELRADGEPCASRALEHRVARRHGAGFAVVTFEADCASAGPLSLDYRLFFDLDPSHRARLRAEVEGEVMTAALSAERSCLELPRTSPNTGNDSKERNVQQ